jgi:hypothetical protein
MPSRSRVMRGAAVLLVLLTFLTGCSAKKMIVMNMKPIIEDMNIAVNRNPDVELVKQSMPAGLVQLDGFITAAPNRTMLISAAEGYFGYSYAFVEDNNKERASLMYLKARDYGLRALMGDGPAGAAFLDMPLDEFKAYLLKFGKRDVPGIYWTASPWMAWAALNINKPEVLMGVPKIEAMLLRCIELDETYYNGAAHAAIGAFYASRAKVIGGDPEKAQEHFKRAFEISNGKILFFYQLYAQFYCYQIQDRDLFEKTLKQVVDTPVNFYPDKNFPNEVAKRKSKDLLDKVDELF